MVGDAEVATVTDRSAGDSDVVEGAIVTDVPEQPPRAATVIRQEASLAIRVLLDRLGMTNSLYNMM
jgi:hypothetical protein